MSVGMAWLASLSAILIAVLLAFIIIRKKQSTEPYVDVYDCETSKTSRIPARELAPGMMQVKIENRDALVWVDSRQLKTADYKRPPFQGRLKEKTKRLQLLLSEVVPWSYEEWEEGLRRDADPEKEIRWWTAMHGIFRIYCEREFRPEKRKEYFHFFMQCTNSTPETILHTFKRTHLTEKEAHRAAKYFFHSGHSGE